MSMFTHVVIGTNDLPKAQTFYDAVLELGGSCEGAPGPRAFGPTAYAAYVRDLDGNKLCAFCFAPG